MAVADLEVEQDVVYTTVDGRELLCDIYRPSATLNKHTALVHLHGGSFRGGSKAGARLARPLAALGYTCVAATYRVLPEAIWPAQMHDVKAAIRWTRANASRLDVEPSKLALVGYSAGAQLSLIAAGSQHSAHHADDAHHTAMPEVTADVAACVALYPPTGEPTHAVLGPSPTQEQVRSFDVLNYITPGFPPTILFHGTADTMVPVDKSFEIAAKLREVGAPVELHIVEGVTHVFESHADLAQASATWIDLFLDRHVVNPRRYPSTQPR